MEVYVLEFSFDHIAIPARCCQFVDLPTRFVLSDDDVDSFREIAGELMRQSMEYQNLLRSFGTVPDE